MFKFTRYFFFIFLITTVIPLLSLFVWTNHQMQALEDKGSQHLIDIGVKQLSSSIEQYLKISECEILEKIQNIPVSELSQAGLKQTFKYDRVELIYNKNINKISSGYETIKINKNSKPEIFSVFVLPIRNSHIKGIKISEKVDFRRLNVNGPFLVEVYSGDTINKNAFVTFVHDQFMPKRHDFNKRSFNRFFAQPMPDQHRVIGIPKDKNTKFATLKVLDNQGKTVVTLLVKVGGHHRPMGPPKALENIFSIIILLAGSLLSLIIAIYVKKNFINPLITLSAASKEVQNGNLSVELSTNIKQEQILNTFNNFNEMLKGLKEKEELRNSFIASLTHDLRTPLIAQERSLALISRKFKELGQTDEYDLAKNVEKNSLHLLRMVNLILESYQFDSQKQNLVFTDISLKELIDNCYEKIKPLTAEKNIEFKNSVPNDLPSIKADVTSMERIFINLISNAVENISENDKIEVSAEIFENIIKIIVEDNGPGIAPEDLSHIFDRYYTGKSLDRKIGSGIGLDVCKKLIKMHNGEISVESEVDKYTKFTIQIPI